MGKNFLRFVNWATAAAVVAMLGYSFVPPTKPVRAQLASIQTWAGNAGGTVNAVTISVHNIAALGDILSVPINFFPPGANTGTTTVTINLDSGSTIGPVNVLRPVPGAGLTAFLGGEFQSTKIATIQYDGTQFECTSCASFTPPGFEQDFSGLVVPTGWLKEDGSAVSRTTFPGLFAALVTSTTANTTNTNTSVSVTSSSTYQVGWFVGGANVTCNSTITSIPDGTHIVLNAGASATGATTLTIGPNPQGDCATTFNVPNRIGRTTAMVDGSTNITTATCTNPGTLGSACGAQTQTLTVAQIPEITATGGGLSVSVSVSGSTSTTIGEGGVNVNSPNSTALNGVGSPVAFAGSFSGSGSGGTSSQSVSCNNCGSQPHPILMPVSLVNKLIKT
jgi:hypothetical protein